MKKKLSKAELKREAQEDLFHYGQNRKIVWL